MGITDFAMGMTKMERFEDFEKLVKRKVDKYKREEDGKKKDKIEQKLRKRLFKFFKELNKLGAIVYLEGKDGKGEISVNDVLVRIPIERLYEVYLIGTLKEINKEIKRRSKDGK